MDIVQENPPAFRMASRPECCYLSKPEASSRSPHMTPSGTLQWHGQCSPRDQPVHSMVLLGLMSYLYHQPQFHRSTNYMSPDGSKAPGKVNILWKLQINVLAAPAVEEQIFVSRRLLNHLRVQSIARLPVFPPRVVAVDYARKVGLLVRALGGELVEGERRRDQADGDVEPSL